MNRINTVENKVLQILRDSPETRYEDMKLYYRYYNRYGACAHPPVYLCR